MPAIKNWAEKIGPFCLIAFLALQGCTPAGPRALLEGARLLDAHKYAEAEDELRKAVTLLATNAQAWNYLGLACQQSGQPADAEKAYHKALTLDHDLTEAHYNLGCLWLEQNKIEAARSEFTAYTLRRGNNPDGFLKLGTAQLRAASLDLPGAARARELSAAEKSFDDALHLSPQNPEGLNGLGLIRLQRGRASEAAQYFSMALKQQPAYAPALLNLAIVAQQHLRDTPLALQKYREYLALKPAPANAAAVKATVHQLETEFDQSAHSPATNAAILGNSNPSAPKPVPTSFTRAVTEPRIAAEPRINSNATVAKPAPAVAQPPPASSEVVKDEPVLKSALDVGAAPVSNEPSISEPANVVPGSPAPPADGKAARRTFWQGLLHGRSSELVTPLPAASVLSQTETVKVAEAKPPPVRYKYKSPAKPAPGNRAEAWRRFAQGMQAQEANHLSEAMKSYRAATQLDASFFEAHYNLGLAASESGDWRAALTAYEFALAIRPASPDARYNFALVLKQAGYPIDAANEFERVLTIVPNEVRAHLALGNLYAQQLQQPAKARQHYQKVLEAQPNHPQAAAIRQWLAQSQPLG